MGQRPKRRKHKDNPYTLGDNEFTVSFVDGQGRFIKVDVSEAIYNSLDKFELHDLKELNEYDNHIEHSELSENTMWKRATINQYSLEEEVQDKFEKEALRNDIQELQEIKKRRLKKYFIDSKTYEEIAQEENCTKRAVKFSVDIAIEKISKKLKN